MCVINNDKFYSFDNTPDLYNLEQMNNNLSIQDVRIKNPDNPAKMYDAKLITFEIEK